jgi:hypothetical protein
MKRKDLNLLKWKEFNYLKIIEENQIKNNKQKILVKCVCWTEKYVALNNMMTWSIKSCWCMKSEIISKTNTTHGMRSLNWIYNIFRSINSRCHNERWKDYKNYWWRWIKCLRESFEDFYRDMWWTYERWLTIDRINNDWNYCKENCRRATIKQQANNKRNNNILLYEWNKYTLSQLSEKLWISRHKIMIDIKHNTGTAKIYLSK